MTACTNHGGKARRVVTAALVGVLSVGTVPMVALAAGAEADGVSLMASDQENWANGDFVFDHEANEDGSYTVVSNDVLSFVSATDAGGNPIAPSDVTVLFFNNNGSDSIQDDNTLTGVDDATLDGKVGSMPSKAADYWVVVFDGKVDLTGKAQTTKLSEVKAGHTYRAFKLTVKADTDSVDGAVAYEGTDLDDTQFNYTGDPLTVNFKLGNEQLVPGTDCNVVWTSVPEGAVEPAASGSGFTVTDAGTYTAKLTGTGDYSGTVEVTVEVKGVDLTEAGSVSVAPSLAGELSVDYNTELLSNTEIVANGVNLATGADVTAELIAVNDSANFNKSTIINASSNTVTPVGKYTFRLTAKQGSKNVTGTTTIDAYVVSNKVVYTYLGDAITPDSNGVFKTFDASLGSVFSAEALGTQQIGGKDVPFTYTVTKDGVAVSSYDEPGTYRIVLDTAVDSKFTYAGHLDTTFVVKGDSYNGSKVYVSYDGKNIADGAKIGYTGEAVEPTVVVRDSDNKVLTEGVDYTVKFATADGEEISSAVEPGDYELLVTFAGEYTDGGAKDNTATLSFEIERAKIVNAEATSEFFGIPEDGAATPTFVGYTTGDLEFDLPSDELSVSYYKVENGVKKPVRADELTEEGDYVANITILSNSEHFANDGVSAVDVKFSLSKTAVFADVDANAWYAQAVTTAYKNWYVNGIAGTNLFAPEAQITRAEVVCILFNMAGGDQVFVDTDFSYSETQGYVTGFSDVDGHAYYAKALAWAHATGVVNGNGGKFMPDEKLTREQFAAMLANYAMSKGDYEASDGSALAALPDASTVSDWAMSAVAWAVENGIMGNGGSVMAQNTITRGEVAAMAVNYQPEPIAEIKNPR